MRKEKKVKSILESSVEHVKNRAKNDKISSFAQDENFKIAHYFEELLDQLHLSQKKASK